jgi:hypothetical protein
MLRVVELRRRAIQGVTLPFLGRTEDDQLYWIKGQAGGYAALCYEWLASRIGQKLGLPLADFEQVEVGADLVTYSALAGVGDLGVGVAFASRHVEGADDLRFKQVTEVDADVRCRVLAFDWLVQNADRTLGARGGNVNLLWRPDAQAVAVIDHNNAFDPAFDCGEFCRDHVFGGELADVEALKSLAVSAAMQDIPSHFPTLWAELPAEWVENAALSPDFSYDRILNVLERVHAPDLLGGLTL